MKYLTAVFQTSDGQWHFQIYSQSVEGIEQVIRMYTVPKLIDALDVASALQLHVDNIETLPVSQYSMQSEGGRQWTAA